MPWCVCEMTHLPPRHISHINRDMWHTSCWVCMNMTWHTDVSIFCLSKLKFVTTVTTVLQLPYSKSAACAQVDLEYIYTCRYIQIPLHTNSCCVMKQYYNFHIRKAPRVHESILCWYWYLPPVDDMTHSHVSRRLIHTRDVTHVCVRHDLFICVKWLLHMCKVNPSYVNAYIVYWS